MATSSIRGFNFSFGRKGAVGGMRITHEYIVQSPIGYYCGRNAKSVKFSTLKGDAWPFVRRAWALDFVDTVCAVTGETRADYRIIKVPA